MKLRSPLALLVFLPLARPQSSGNGTSYCADATFFAGADGMPADCTSALNAMAQHSGTPTATICSMTVGDIEPALSSWTPSVPSTFLIADVCCAACSAASAVSYVDPTNCSGVDTPGFFEGAAAWCAAHLARLAAGGCDRTLSRAH